MPEKSANSHNKISSVATNIITGFLGVGKTTAILNLLKQKPAHERWAILVNEFGEIGIDGSLISQPTDNNNPIFIRELPGGCMCCTAGAPMRVALTQLLKQAKPDRLLIEPTGLGHPKEVLQVLTSEQYSGVIDLQKTITLVDARQLNDARYTEHQTFNQQIAIADIIVGNKKDLYQATDENRLRAYVEKISDKQPELSFCQDGELSINLLDFPNKAQASSLEQPISTECCHGGPRAGHSSVHSADHSHSHSHSHSDHEHSKPKTLATDLPMPKSGIIRVTNSGEGYQSIGWRFAKTKVFDQQKLNVLFNQFKTERLKAVINTENGAIGYNLTRDGVNTLQLEDTEESRIEVIMQNVASNSLENTAKELEHALLSCLIK